MQFIADLFWKRFVSEYASTLHLRTKWLRSRRCLKEGDLVLMVDGQLPRGYWKTARVIQVYRNETDGLVRNCRVRTSSSEYDRPIQKLVLLEELVA